LYNKLSFFLANFEIINHLKIINMSATNAKDSKKADDKKTTKKAATDTSSKKDTTKAAKKITAKK